MGAQGACQGDIRKQISDRRADFGIRRRQPPLRLLNIRAATQKIRREAHGYALRQHRNRSRTRQFLRQSLGILAQQHRDRVATGLDLRPEWGLLGLQGSELSLREADVEFIGQSAIQPRLREIKRRPRRLDIAAQNSQLSFLGSHVEIGARDIGSDRHVNPVTRVLQRFGTVGRRLDLAFHPAEEIKIPIGAETSNLTDRLQILAVVGGPKLGRRASL